MTGPAASRPGAPPAGPVFLLGIQRGGTNQLLNILRSHPATAWPQGEFHEVFRLPSLRAARGLGIARVLRMARAYAPIRLTAGDILDPDRPPAGDGLLRGARGRAVAAGLARSMAANRATVAGFKAALATRGLIEQAVASERMVVKVMNYNLAFAEDLAALYPDAVFVGIIRDGRAVCEGHVARGAGLAAAAEAYAFVGRRLVALEAAGLPIRTWRFEDLLADPAGVATAVWSFAGLDPALARGVALQDKQRVLDARGAVRGIRKQLRFYTLEEMARHMRPDANAAARAMAAEARAAIEARAGDVLTHFGYLAPDREGSYEGSRGGSRAGNRGDMEDRAGGFGPMPGAVPAQGWR